MDSLFLGIMMINTDDNQSNFLNFRISSAYQKWNDLRHVLTDRRVKMTTRTQILEACIRSFLLYSVQAWELSSRELNKIESIWHNVLENDCSRLQAGKCSIGVIKAKSDQIRNRPLISWNLYI